MFAVEQGTKISLYLLIPLMALQSIMGIVLGQRLYARDDLFSLSAWRANDIVTCVIALPLLTWSTLKVQDKPTPSSNKHILIWISMIFYVFYNYSYYVFGTKVNLFWPVYITLFAVALVTLLYVIHHLLMNDYLAALARDVALTSNQNKLIAGFCGVFVLCLLISWVGGWALFAIFGRPLALDEQPFQLIAGMDMTFQVPFLSLAAILLWKDSNLGIFLGGIWLISGGVYMCVLILTAPFCAFYHVPGAFDTFPLWLVLCTGCSWCSWMMLKSPPRKQV